MRKLFILKFLLITFSLITLNAHAVIVEGSFRGIVGGFTNGDESNGLDKYIDVEGDLSGTEAWGTFWYDTDKSQPDWMNSPTSAEYRSDTDIWVNTTFYIGGKSVSVSDLKPPANDHASTEGVWLSRDYWGNGAHMLHIFDYTSNGYPWDQNVRSFIEIISEDKPILNELNLIQEFDWFVDDDPGYFGQAEFSAYIVNGQVTKQASFGVGIQEFHIRVRNSASVPEPSSLLLLLVGFLSLYLIRKQFISEK